MRTRDQVASIFINDGRTEGRRDGWTGGMADGRTERPTDEQRDRRTDRPLIIKNTLSLKATQSVHPSDGKVICVLFTNLIDRGMARGD